MEENVTTEPEVLAETERMAEIAILVQLTGNVYEAFYGITHSEDWKSFEIVEEQLAFRNALAEFYLAACIVREKFDSDVWKGHSDGTVNLLVTSIRKQREGDAPGKKAAPVTAASLLAKRLAK